MAWTIRYDDVAKKHLSKLDKPVAKQILDYMDNEIAPLDDPYSRGHGLSGRLSGFWRYRCGNYRIICDISRREVTIFVVDVGDRKAVYI